MFGNFFKERHALKLTVKYLQLLTEAQFSLLINLTFTLVLKKCEFHMEILLNLKRRTYENKITKHAYVKEASSYL